MMEASFTLSQQIDKRGIASSGTFCVEIHFRLADSVAPAVAATAAAATVHPSTAVVAWKIQVETEKNTKEIVEKQKKRKKR